MSREQAVHNPLRAGFSGVSLRHISAAAKKFWRGNPAEARDRIRSVYEREIAQLEAKSGIRIDKQMRAVRVVELTDYAPLMPAGK